MAEPSTESPLRVGVVGVGGILGTHMPGWEASPHTTVAACCDVREEAATGFAKKREIETVYTDYEKLLADDSIDVIDLAVPTAFHAPMTIQALEAGKHVFCEKPLAPTPKEIEQIIEARDKSGKMTCTMQNQRYTPESKALRRRFHAGDLGNVYHARLWWLRRTQLPARPGFVYKKNSGGGPCIDIGVHILDLALWLMGNRKPVAVSGTARKEVAAVPGAWSSWGGDVPPDMDVEDFAAGFVRLDDGSTLILEVSWLMHHPQEEVRAWFYGSEGGVTYPDGTVYKSDNEAKMIYDVNLKPGKNALGDHALCCMDFAEALVTGGDSPVPAEQSLAVMRILDGLYRSEASGGEVRF
ncbi:MAG: Gfo/Idh/MocA family oxidoreductase [Planctomycetota bacterium]